MEPVGGVARHQARQQIFEYFDYELWVMIFHRFWTQPIYESVTICRRKLKAQLVNL